MVGVAMFVCLVVCLSLVGMLLLWLMEVAEEAERRRMESSRNKIERLFPGTRATPLSTGNWLLTSIATGRTVREIKPGDMDNPVTE